MCRRKYVGTLALTACICFTLCSYNTAKVYGGQDTPSASEGNKITPVQYDRVLLPDNDPPEGFGGQTRGNCGNVVYEDAITTGTGAQNPIWNGNDANFPWIYAGDDVTLAGTDRFVCEFTARLGTGNITQTASFAYTFQFWDVAGTTVCPDAGATMLYGSAVQIATGFAGSGASQPFQTAISPAVGVPNSFWIILRTPTTNTNPYVRFRTDSANPDVGDTQDFFYVGYNNNRCDDPAHFLVYTGISNTGFAYQLLANQGPSGSCCNQQTGVCTDGVLLGNCGDYFNVWNINPGCPAGCAQCDVTCTGATLTENEPNCAANYIDTTNNGCSFDEGTESFINVSCGVDICGKFGTYTFLNGTVTQNRRDNDYYRLTLTNTRQVNFTATGEAPMQVIIFIPRLGPGMGPCDDIATITSGNGTLSGSSVGGCHAATALTCLPPGTYYCVARANSTIGIPCGLDYRATITCTPCTLPTGACCLPAGCSALEEVRCLQQGGDYRGDGTTCPPTPPCPPPPTNETCLTKNTVPTITNNRTIAFDTTFAITESTANIAECTNLPIYKDVWYDYVVPGTGYTPGGVSFGRIAVSTYGSCFDTRLLVYRVVTCGDTQANQCANAVPLVCNDDINTDRGDLASYLVVDNNGEDVQPNVGECYKIRVGGADVDQGGPGFLRVDFLPSGASPWSDGSGRCCFANGTCQITVAPGNPPNDCASLGGYFTNTTSFGEGDPAYTEYNSIGCNTVPCPAAGEACYNALNLNTAPGIVSNFGTTTRAITNRLYYRYQIPVTMAPGRGLTFSTCGSDFNTAIAVYSAFDTASGQCINDSSLLAKNDNCTPQDTSAAGANGIASCFQSGETDSCLCLTVGNIGSATGPGSVIYIEIGASNGVTGSTLPTVDPVPENCGTAVTASLTVTNATACFVCNVPCPGGSVAEGEPACGPNYVDTTNAGCNASPATFKDITCGQTICGNAGNYVFTNGTTATNFRDLDWYRFTVTSAKTVNIALKASFQSVLFLVAAANPSNACDTTTLAVNTASAGCLDTSITQAVCSGTFYIIVGPSVFTGVDCGSQYSFTLNCNAAPVTNCCKGDMNNNGTLAGDDISLFVKNLLLPPITLLPTTGCYNLNTCRADFNNDYVLTTADIPGFVTALLTKAACPSLASCTDPAKCHFSDQSGGAISDIGTSAGCSQRVADDFKPDSTGNIQNICWYGSYLNFLNSTACTPQSGSSPDAFCVTIYNDSAGVPGTVRGGPFCALTVTKTDTGVDIPFTGFGNAREWRYSAALPSPVAVTAGTCYWIEIVNATSGNCCWLWSLSAFTNDVSASRSGGPAGTPNYVAGDIDSGDFAFCLNDIRINKRDCGLPQGRCCYPNPGGPVPLCAVTDVFNCQNVLHGNWNQGGNCSTSCPIPPADNCAQAAVIPLNTNIQGTTIGLTTDGPQPSCDTTNIAPDGWYKVTATATANMTASLCPGGINTLTDYDSIITAYSGTCATLNEVGCGDDTCGVGAGPSTITWAATSGTVYYVRVLGWNNSAGNFTLRVTNP